MRRSEPDRLTLEYVHSVLCYDENTGVLVWRSRRVEDFKGNYSAYCAWTAKNGGRIAGSVDKIDGYRRLGLLGRLYRAHRIAWFYVYGEMPRMLDHINGDKDDNRISNLRVASPVVNGRNQKRHVTNTSGVTGVSRRKDGRWTAYIGDGTKPKRLGDFFSFDDAVAARRAAEVEFGYEARHGAADAR